jgi:antitoxin component YwqK of YwqJK toxin-antitoxin module
MKYPEIIFISFLLAALLTGCGSGDQKTASDQDKDSPSLIRSRRDDGTLSSVSPVDKNGYVHGIRVNYYEDGRTVHSKVTYEHGRKHGPAQWYYKSGKLFEHTEFYYGRRNGVTRRYYESGALMEEVTYEKGKEMPGKKRYDKNGQPIPD